MFAVENDGVVTNGETVHYPLAVPVPMHHKVDGWSEDPCQSVSEYVWVQIVRVGSATVLAIRSTIIAIFDSATGKASG